MKLSISRRSFLSTSSLAAAGFGLHISSKDVGACPPFGTQIRSQSPASTFFPDLIDPDQIRSLALKGIEAARESGAFYADIRIANMHKLQMIQSGPILPFSDLYFEYAYGIRVLVNGIWGFAFGVDPDVDSLSRAAKTAVATARGLGKISPYQGAQSELIAPNPVARGEWRTPIQIDPFSVSPDDHAKMLGAYKDAVERVVDASIFWLRFSWITETRVFASTEGSLITQHFTKLNPLRQVQIRPPMKSDIYLSVPGVEPVSAGFEIAMGPSLQERIKAAAEEAAELATYPESVAGVGRFEAVPDGTAMAAMLGGTLAKALEMDRVLGYDADGAGTSFLSQVDDILGRQLFSPQLNVTSDRSMPSYNAAKWDDEGVATSPLPLIQNGKVVNYLTTRSTVTKLAFLYAKLGKPCISSGSAISWNPSMSPSGCATQLNIEPDSSGNTLESLISRVKRGVLVRGVTNDGLNSDQQLAGGSLNPSMLYEINQGRITRRLTGAAIQFSTKKLLSSIRAVGDASTLQHYVQSDVRGETFAWTTVPVSSPAMHLSQVDVIQTGRRF